MNTNETTHPVPASNQCNNTRIAWELDAIAAARCYFENALRVTKSMSCVTPEQHSLLDRYLAGNDVASDSFALQDLANQIRNQPVADTPLYMCPSCQAAHREETDAMCCCPVPLIEQPAHIELQLHTCHKCKHAYEAKWDAQNCCEPEIQTRYACSSCKKHYKTPSAASICCRREVNQKASCQVRRSEIIHSLLCLLQTVRYVTDNEYTESFEEYESLAFDDIGGLIQELIEESPH